jgi:hypothetical protein
MKKLFLLILSVSILTIAFAQSGLPGTWNQNTAYASGSLVISNGSTYLAQQAVPSGTALTSSAYWQSLDSAVPTSTPGAAPTSTPDVTTAPTSTPAPTSGTDNNVTTTPTFKPGFRADGSQMDSSIPVYFDVDGYYDRNHDVRDNLKNQANDGVKAYEHYLNFGVSEDRMFDNSFVPLEYVSINTDLRVVFTDENGSVDLKKAVNHWFDFGMAEGRAGRFAMPTWFDAQQYMDNHNDVRDALDDNSSFGKDTEAWWHFYRIGAPQENRSWNDEEFTLDAYISLNQDVYVSFQNDDRTVDKKRAMYHYIYAGNSEGRVDTFSVPVWFNSSEYLGKYTDVAGGSWGTSTFKAFNHFFRFGALEGRTTSTFDLDAYISLNQDVWLDRQQDRFETVLHFIAYGYAENRKATY